MQIKTFEELYEEVKKLYPEVKTFGKKTIRIFTGFKQENFYTPLEYRIHNKDNLGKYKITEGVDERIIAPPTKDPQKIYNVIKALEECE